ncbi:hypothetical protein ACFL0U_00455 [Pseudomonadota bacterium]
MEILQKINTKLKKLFFIETWNVGILKGNVKSFLDKSYLKKEIVWLPKKFGHIFYADPFGFELRDKKYIIYEYFSYIGQKGKIDIIEVNDNFEVIKKYKNVLRHKFHLSYPHPIEYKNEIYFIVECNKSNELVLYKLNKRNFKLERVKRLIEGQVVDASILKYKNKWWLFFTLEDEGWNKLFVAYAGDLFGEWKMHKKNPVKADIKSARCGGTIFKYKNELFRPAQDCSRTYGGAINICKIEKLTTTAFEEKIISHIEPFTKYKDGIHTISQFGNVMLIDGKGKEFAILKPLVSWTKNINRLIRKIL